LRGRAHRTKLSSRIAILRVGIVVDMFKDDDWNLLQTDVTESNIYRAHSV